MELTKTVLENLGKAFLNVGQGMLVTTFASGFFATESRISTTVVGLFLGGYTIYLGLYFVSKSKHVED